MASGLAVLASLEISRLGSLATPNHDPRQLFPTRPYHPYGRPGFLTARNALGPSQLDVLYVLRDEEDPRQYGCRGFSYSTDLPEEAQSALLGIA